MRSNPQLGYCLRDCTEGNEENMPRLIPWPATHPVPLYTTFTYRPKIVSWACIVKRPSLKRVFL